MGENLPGRRRWCSVNYYLLWRRRTFNPANPFQRAGKLNIYAEAKNSGLPFRLHGWRLVGRPVPPEAHRCVFVFAPHTSNWDFYFGTLCMMSWGIPIKVARSSDFGCAFPLV
ncbi:MAG: hypothetical protein R2795_22565 [Saprospiraceae bacterium]